MISLILAQKRYSAIKQNFASRGFAVSILRLTVSNSGSSKITPPKKGGGLKKTSGHMSTMERTAISIERSQFGFVIKSHFFRH